LALPAVLQPLCAIAPGIAVGWLERRVIKGNVGEIVPGKLTAEASFQAGDTQVTAL
jgi:hypothetical protein